MEIPVKLDASRVTYPGLLEVLSPIVPGSILTIGSIVMNPSVVNHLLGFPGLGYRTKIAILALGGYIAGLLLQQLVGYTSYAVGYLVAYTGIFKNALPKAEPWKNSTWRKIAGVFIGPQFQPKTEALYFPKLEEDERKRIEALPEGDAKAAQKKVLEDYFGPIKRADPEWYWWHQILTSYFAEPTWHAPPAGYFLAMLHTSAWAVILLMVGNHRHHWFAWVLCVLGLYFGNFAQWFGVGIYGPDPYGTELAAKIFKEMKSHSNTLGHDGDGKAE